ncbi:unnamed protein product, partial [Prorocentrum cordatum]
EGACTPMALGRQCVHGPSSPGVQLLRCGAAARAAALAAEQREPEGHDAHVRLGDHSQSGPHPTWRHASMSCARKAKKAADAPQQARHAHAAALPTRGARAAAAAPPGGARRQQERSLHAVQQEGHAGERACQEETARGPAGRLALEGDRDPG